jgi:hypothetical protein
VSVRVADIASDLSPAVLWRCEELGASRAPLLIDGLNIGDANVEEAARAVEVRRRFEDDGRLVLRGAAADVDDDPAVGEWTNEGSPAITVSPPSTSE